MTSRADLPRLAASLGVLGTELEMKGPVAWDRLKGWEQGPTRTAPAAPESVCRCGHADTSHDREEGICTYVGEVDGFTWACVCLAFASLPRVGAEDRRAEMRQAARAAEQWSEFAADLAALNRLVVSINTRLDMAIPPEMDELRNRRTGEFDPETATDALAAGFCPNCWSCGVRQVPLSPYESTKTGGGGEVRRYADRCRPCGDFRKSEGIDKPKELVVGHAQIPPRRFSPAEHERIVNAAKAAAAPAKGKKKSKRKKAA